MQTLRAGCSKVEPIIFAPLQTPFPGARNDQTLISWRWSLPSLETQFGEDQYTQFRVIVVTEPHTVLHTHSPTHRQDRLLYTVPELGSAQCKQHKSTFKGGCGYQIQERDIQGLTVHPPMLSCVFYQLQNRHGSLVFVLIFIHSFILHQSSHCGSVVNTLYIHAIVTLWVWCSEGVVPSL